MKPRDILNLAVRLLGLVFLYQGLQALPTAAIQFCSAISNMNSGAILPCLVMAGWPLLVSYWLLRGAPLIIRTAYPDASTSTEAQIQIGKTLA
jgi:hypothetical protein